MRAAYHEIGDRMELVPRVSSIFDVYLDRPIDIPLLSLAVKHVVRNLRPYRLFSPGRLGTRETKVDDRRAELACLGVRQQYLSFMQIAMLESDNDFSDFQASPEHLAYLKLGFLFSGVKGVRYLPQNIHGLSPARRLVESLRL